MNNPIPKPYIMQVPLYVPGAHDNDHDIPPAILSANENPLGCSPQAQAVLRHHIHHHRYPDGASHALKNAIAATYGLDKKRIITTAGSDELISMICRAFVGEGDEVIMSQYGFLMVEISAKLCGAKVIKADECDYHANIDALLAAVTPNSKILFLANPNNPTGTYLDKEQIKALHQNLPPHILLVLDAAYCEFIDEMDYSQGNELVAEYTNVIVTRTFSKIYGLAALRLGWGYADAGLIEILERVRPPFNTSMLAQMAGIAALQDQEFVIKTRLHVAKERKNLQHALYQLGHNLGWRAQESFTNFIMLRLNSGGEAERLDHYLKQEGVIVRRLAAYDIAEGLRITIGTEEENQRLITAIKHYIEHIKHDTII